MKFIKYITPVLFCGALTLQSCEHFLDTKPMESYSEELVWNSKSTADAFVVQTYSGIMGWYHDIRTEEQWTLNSVMRQSCPAEAKDLKDRNWDFGFGQFKTVRRCNLIIEKAQASTGISDADKKALAAEGKMLRAMTYYYQAKHTGRFIWVDRVLTEEDEFNLPLTESIDKSYDLILKDLDDAIAGLPETSAQGRLNANAARALKSEVCLTAAAYSTDDTRKRTLFEQAVAAVDAIQGYTLDSNYGGMFNQEGAKSSPEIILAQYYSKDNTSGSGTLMQEMLPNQSNDRLKQFGGRPYFNQDLVFECWLEHSPSQNLIDDYLVTDLSTNQAVKWNESSQFVANTAPLSNADVTDLAVNAKELDANSLAYKTNSNSANIQINDFIYQNRDQRFYHSIQYDSCMFYNELITTHQGGNLYRTAVDGKTPGQGYVPVTNYIWKKYIYINNQRIFWNIPTDYHYVIFRYGRALLNKAEALLCLAQFDASNIAKAVSTFNQTRVTHGKLPASTATTLADAWRDYKIERHVDLALESDYYWSLLRWGKYGGEANHGKPAGDIIPELNSPATFIEISKDRHRMFVGTVGYTNADRSFSVKRYLFPIPQGVINANSAINDSDQNPGW